jgi:carboxypeptidase C (cathepsin A)
MIRAHHPRRARCARVLGFLLAALLSTVLPAHAARSKPSPSPSPTAAPSAEPVAYPDAVTEHTIVLGGKTIAYTARAGTITLFNQKEQPTARMFYTAFTENGANPATRPVTFIYNGGPGSSTMWLRMGSIGPVRVLAANGAPSGPPPYRIVDNPYSLLDKSDLVFIDMPDTGFGRIIGAGTTKEFFGVDQDVAAFGQFISRYISTFDRWNSPKFLFGESYGTTRSAALADYLLVHGISLNGVILQSSILNFGLDFTSGAPIGGGDWAYVLYLPTEAATAWYYHKVPNEPNLANFISRVESFAMGEYLDALYRGDRVSSSERGRVAQTLSTDLGVPLQYVLESNLRVPYPRFQRELLRIAGRVIGRLDSRYSTSTTDRASYEGPPWDPTDSSIDAPYTTAVNQYIREDLKYNPPIEYRPNVYDLIFGNGHEWDFTHKPPNAERLFTALAKMTATNVAPDLADAMTENPKLQVFSANGYYDFATPFFATQYTLDHLNIAPSLQHNVTYGFYEAGHMIYLSDSALARYKADLARWYDRASAQ